MSRLAALAAVALAHSVVAAEPPTFERDVKPLLVAKCVKCHGGETTKSGLDLRTEAAIKRGGDTGPSVVPGDPAKSLLFEQITSGTMPPGKAVKFTQAEIALVNAWIDGGTLAEESGRTASSANPTHWAFRSPACPSVPPVTETHHPIDAFLLAKLQANGLSFSPPTERLALLRRVTVDLTGLLPKRLRS